MPLFQKPLGWLQRFLYNVESGQVPFPTPTISIDLDWPLEPTMGIDSRITSAGTEEYLTFSPPGPDSGNQFHAIVTDVSIRGNTPFPATDEIHLVYRFAPYSLTNPTNAEEIVLWSFSGYAMRNLMLVGGLSFETALIMPGHRPVYVAPGHCIFIRHGSAAGGVTVNARALVYSRPKSHPLWHP